MGPRAHLQAGHAGLIGWATPSPIGSLASVMSGRGGSFGVEEEGEKGPAGPLAHHGDAGEGSLARGSWSAVQSTAAARRSGEGISDGGGFSGRSSSIPSTGRARRRWRSFPARRWRLGWCGTVALPSGHGGGAGVLGGGRGSEPGREREGRGGPWRAGGGSRGSFSASKRQAGGGSPIALRRTRRCAAYWKKKKEGFCRKPPGVWKIF
jgi:hypothetical protein